MAYSVEGIGATLLLIAAAVSSYFEAQGARVSVFLYLAVALSAIRLLLTVKAAPIMLSLRSPQPTAALQSAFDGFFFWGFYLRRSANTLAFLAAVLALSGL